MSSGVGRYPTDISQSTPAWLRLGLPWSDGRRYVGLGEPDAEAFLTLLFEGLPGSISIRAINPDLRMERWVVPSLQDAIQLISGDLLRKGVCELFAEPCTYDADGQAEAVRVLWAAQCREEPRRNKGLTIPRASFRVRSSDSTLFWLLDRPVLLGDPDQAESFRLALARTSTLLAGETAAHPNALVRIPGSDDLRHLPRPVEMEWFWPEAYSLAELECIGDSATLRGR